MYHKSQNFCFSITKLLRKGVEEGGGGYMRKIVFHKRIHEPKKLRTRYFFDFVEISTKSQKYQIFQISHVIIFLHDLGGLLLLPAKLYQRHRFKRRLNF